MDILEFVERITGLKLMDFQKLYLTRLYDIYEKDPDSFNKFTYPCCRGYARFNRLPLLAAIFDESEMDIVKAIDERRKEMKFDINEEHIEHPKHYNRDGALECIDEMILIFGKEAVADFCKCNAWKYRYRAADKNGQEDLEKSDWYLRKYEELTSQKCRCPDEDE